MSVCEWCDKPVTRMGKKTGKPWRFCSHSCRGAYGKSHARDMSGPNNPRYNGGFSKSDGRTVVCTRDGGFVFWYRIVIEDAIGRPLTPEEIVHHINGDPTDDRLENLELTTRAEHASMHLDERMDAYRKTLDKRQGLPHRWDLNKYRSAA